MRPIIHPASQLQLDGLFKHPPHAVLLSGPVGVGLATIAQHYVKQTGFTVIPLLPEKDDKIDLDKGTIAVNSIRRLYDMTKAIEPKGRIVIIDYAERMAPAAQNAFLKLLEEPTDRTYFILLSHTPETLLPTILSRVQRIDVRPITSDQSQAFIESLKISDPTHRVQLLFIAEGLPAELSRLVRDKTYFEKRAAIVKAAREYITGSGYTKLRIAKQYKDSRETALVLIEDALKLLRRTLTSQTDQSALQMIDRLETIHGRISRQGNVRLQLSAGIML